MKELAGLPNVPWVSAPSHSIFCSNSFDTLIAHEYAETLLLHTRIQPQGGLRSLTTPFDKQLQAVGCRSLYKWLQERHAAFEKWKQEHWPVLLCALDQSLQMLNTSLVKLIALYSCESNGYGFDI